MNGSIASSKPKPSLPKSSASTSLNKSTEQPSSETLHPVPVLNIAELPSADVWGFLNETGIIDSPDHLALHVAQLTLGMAELKARLDSLVTVEELFELWKREPEHER